MTGRVAARDENAPEPGAPYHLLENAPQPLADTATAILERIELLPFVRAVSHGRMHRRALAFFESPERIRSAFGNVRVRFFPGQLQRGNRRGLNPFADGMQNLPLGRGRHAA